MNGNLRIWSALEKTDPAHTKGFQRAGGFKGTAVKPIWCTKRLTELFGPCGVGWGMTKPEFSVVPASEEVMVFCTVGIWYIDTGSTTKSDTVYGVGGDKVASKNKHGLATSDEAFKAAYTDALSNAMKQIGVAADVHMGLFDDHKYVREVTREFAEEAHQAEAPKPAAPPKATPTAAPPAPAAVPDDRKDSLRSYANDVARQVKAAKSVDGIHLILNDPKIDELKAVSTAAWDHIENIANDRIIELGGMPERAA